MAMVAFRGPEQSPHDEGGKETAEKLKIAKEAPYESLAYLKANATYANCRLYAENLDAFEKDNGLGAQANAQLEKRVKAFDDGKSAEAKADIDVARFVLDARKFLRPVTVADFALDAWQKAQNNALYTVNTYGAYDTLKAGQDMNTTKVNDCFTFTAKVNYGYMNNVDTDSGYKMAYSMVNALPYIVDGNARKTTSVSLTSQSHGTLHLQVGDIIQAGQSQFGSGNSHWGVVVEDGGKLYVVNRGSTLIFKSTLEEFLKNNSLGNIMVVRYGAPACSQHFDIDVTSKMDASTGWKRVFTYDVGLVDGAVPTAIYEKAVEKSETVSTSGTKANAFMK